MPASPSPSSSTIARTHQQIAAIDPEIRASQGEFSAQVPGTLSIESILPAPGERLSPIMRSGFLNASLSGFPASTSNSSSQEKGSRNKRKFRTDQQASPPLQIPVCSDVEASRDLVNVVETGSNWTMDCPPLNNGDVVADSIDSTACCSSEIYDNSQDHLNPIKASNAGDVRFPICGIKAADCPSGFQLSSYCKDDHQYEELQEPDWDQFSEAQLEGILMNMLEALYKDAVKMIMSCDYGQEEALDAVLRNGRWNGRDALTSVVENSLTWLRNCETQGEIREPTFSDLKEMESYVLAEMVCMLRKVRPFLSKGDAMWCLLMCDMNVLLACTMDDDVVPSTAKDAPPPAVAPLHAKGVSNPSTGVPLPQQMPCLPQACSQSLGPYKDNRSAFSAPSFSSTPVGKVAVACRQSSSEDSCISRIAHSSSTLLNCKGGSSVQEQEVQAVNNSSPCQAPLVRIPTSQEQTKKLGSYLPKSFNGGQYLGKSHNLMPEHVVSDATAAETCPVFNQDKHMMQAAANRCFPLSFESTFRSSLSGHPPSESSSEPAFSASRLKCGSNFVPVVQLPGDTKDPGPTDVQRGNASTFLGFQTSPREAWTDSDTSSNNVNSLAPPGMELSLATVPVAASVSTELSSEAQCEDCKEESSVNSTSHDVSITHNLGCADVDGEERKTDILWQLIERVRDLEAQLQEWTEWAQQKVMQAARRLTKDTAELKALRLEREEYMRLKKEKQALEESTLKKLSEMENSLRKALSQVDRANTTARRLETENAEVRAEMEAAKLTAAESVSVCQEATKREKKSMKKAQVWEKQKMKLQEDLAQEKRKLTNLLQQLSQAKERQQQAEVRWRQEKKAKEEALAHAEAEKQAKEHIESSIKRREESLRRKSDLESQHHRDDIQKLECEISRLKMSSGLQPTMLRWGNGFGVSSNNMDTCTAEKLKQINARLLSEIADLQDSQRDVHRDRECVMCMSEEMSVVFLPCAHQVVCIKCNDLHEKQGLRDCPSCRTPIQQRIHVFGVKS